jgi:hypothetical protein
MMRFDFPLGYHAFNPVKIINFQLNRWYSLGYARLEDVKSAGEQIRTFDDWKRVMTDLAEKAVADERWINAAFYYRAAEFFVLSTDPDKELLYNRFSDIFYNRAFAGEPIERHKVPYEGSYLPALRILAELGPVNGSLVIHGGFDSFIEEWYSCATFFAAHGYDVIMFEGPGQGAALKKEGLPLTHEWEKPVKAVLDYFRLENVTLLGISMGGWICFRAAAFEPRIRRVIASSIAFDYLQMPPLPNSDPGPVPVPVPKADELSGRAEDESQLPGAVGDQQPDVYHEDPFTIRGVESASPVQRTEPPLGTREAGCPDPDRC